MNRAPLVWSAAKLGERAQRLLERRAHRGSRHERRCSIGSLTGRSRPSEADRERRRPARVANASPARSVTRRESRRPPAKAGGDVVGHELDPVFHARPIERAPGATGRCRAGRTEGRHVARARDLDGDRAWQIVAPDAGRATPRPPGRARDPRPCAISPSSARPRSVVPLWLPRSRTRPRPRGATIERCRRLTAADATGSAPTARSASGLEHAPDDDSLAEDNRHLAALDRHANRSAPVTCAVDHGEPPRAEHAAGAAAREIDGFAPPAAARRADRTPRAPRRRARVRVPAPARPRAGRRGARPRRCAPARGPAPRRPVRGRRLRPLARRSPRRLQNRPGLGELRSPRRRHRDGRRAREDRQSARPCARAPPRPADPRARRASPPAQARPGALRFARARARATARRRVLSKRPAKPKNLPCPPSAPHSPFTPFASAAQRDL